jgi:hypothetical protein
MDSIKKGDLIVCPRWWTWQLIIQVDGDGDLKKIDVLGDKKTKALFLWGDDVVDFEIKQFDPWTVEMEVFWYNATHWGVYLISACFDDAVDLEHVNDLEGVVEQWGGIHRSIVDGINVRGRGDFWVAKNFRITNESDIVYWIKSEHVGLFSDPGPLGTRT